MTVRDLIDKLNGMVARDAAVADLPVDSEGCDYIEPAVDAVERNGREGRRILIARESV